MVKIGMLIADRYEVLEKIGTGGMSVVYKAKDHKLNRYVAMKILKQEFADNANFVSKFRIEAQAAGGLIHSNIVNVYDVGDEKGVNYIVMELVDGITLKKYIEKKVRLSTKEAISIAIQVSMGLQAAHANHIIHRDIKPQNIIISKDGKVKVTDFGIAKAATSNTITSNVMGSVHYTSPEQARGGYSDERSDIYSLGVSIFEMLTGRVPFNGETTVAIAIKHIQSPMPSPREFVPDIPRSVEQIVLKCCEKSPDRRYQSMDELIADLKQSLIHPDDDFVKVIHPDEEGATRMASHGEQQAIRRGDSDYQEPPMEDDDVYDRYEDDDRLDDEPVYREEERYVPRRTDRIDMNLRKNRDVRKRYDENDYSDDFDEDDNYDPRRERRVTILSILAAIIVGLLIILFAASRMGLLGGSTTQPGEETTAEAGNVIMPIVTGQNVDKVTQQLKDLGLVVEVEYEASSDQEVGIVLSSNVAEGSEVAKGSSVVLKVSAGLNGITVPDVTDKSQPEAVATLKQKGFAVAIEQIADNEIESGNVAKQSPEGEQSAPAGSTITIYISTGPDMEGKAKVPDVVGLTSEEAMAKLVEAKLQMGEVTEVDADDPNLSGLVTKQSIEKDEIVDENTKVDLTINKAKVSTFSYSGEIQSPAAEDPNFVPGTQVYVVLIAQDGTSLLDTHTSSFPLTVSYTGLGSAGGTLKMSYTGVIMDPETGVQSGTEEKVVSREIAFTPEQ